MKRSRDQPARMRNGMVLGGLVAIGGLLLAYRPLALDVRLQSLLRQPTSIQRIQHHQGLSLQGTVVSVDGIVGDRAPFIGFEMYELKQEKDRLWVMTSGTDAQMGDRVRVRGQIQAKTIEQDAGTSRDYYLREL